MSPSGSRSLDVSLPILTPGDVVLVASADPPAAAHIVEALADCGHAVVGPVDRAAAALMFAGQAPVTRAIVFSRLAGRRCGRELIEALRSSFGIDALLIDHGDEAGGGDDRSGA